MMRLTTSMTSIFESCDHSPCTTTTVPGLSLLVGVAAIGEPERATWVPPQKAGTAGREVMATWAPSIPGLVKNTSLVMMFSYAHVRYLMGGQPPLLMM
jgi:hypothetical protein